MPENERFNEWFTSPYYHKLYSDSAGNDTTKFLTNLCAHLGVKPTDKILDAACRDGKNAVALAKMGFRVTGVDISSDHINAALPNASESLDFFLHDIRLPFWGNYFNYIFILDSNFGFFRTRREHEAAIRTISRGLRPKGFFVIDYANVHFSEDNLKPFETKTVGDTMFEIENTQDENYFYKKIKITSPSQPEALQYTEQSAKFSFGDFTDMMSFHGLQVREIFGDHDLSTYNVKSSPRMIIIAEKARIDSEDKEKRLYSDGRKTDALT